MSQHRPKGKYISSKIVIDVILIMVLAMSVFILVSAFDSQRATTAIIEGFLEETADQIEETIPDGATKDRLELYLEKLEVVTDQGMQASTVTFLLQVFSVALLTIGGYLVMEVQRRADEAKKEVEKAKKAASIVTRRAGTVGKFVISGVSVQVLFVYLANAYQDSWLATKTAKAHKAELVPRIRDWVEFFTKQLFDSVGPDTGIEEGIHAQLFDQLTAIQVNLNELNMQGEEVDDILKRCDRCMNLLLESDMVEIYEHQLALLMKVD